MEKAITEVFKAKEMQKRGSEEHESKNTGRHQELEKTRSQTVPSGKGGATTWMTC